MVDGVTSPESGGVPSTRRVVVADSPDNGTRLTLRADVFGAPTDPPVVLAHGGGQTRHSWGSTAETLASHGWQAIAYDHRGHGESDRSPTADYRLQRFSDDLLALSGGLDARPVVVGASLGGLAALNAEGHTRPGSFAAVVLVDITPRQEAAGVTRIVEFMMDRAETGYASLDEAADAIAAYQPHRERPSTHDGLRKNLRLDADGRWRWHWDPLLFNDVSGLSGASEQARIADAARLLSCPVMLIRGLLSDLVSEDTSRELMELVPHARSVDVTGAGHMVAGDRNDLFTTAVVDFLDALRA